MPKKRVEQRGQLEIRFDLPPAEVTAQPTKSKQERKSAQSLDPPAAPTPTSGTPTRFEKRFHAVTRRNWEITFTRNKSVMISYKSETRPPSLRIHVMFADADNETIEAIARVVEGKGHSWPRIVNDYITRHTPDYAEERPARRVTLEAAGRYVDLRPLFDKMNRLYFDNRIDSRLGWMTPRIQRRVSIKLGSFSEETNVIRIHPALDHPDVPIMVIEAILFHEMVHAQVKTMEIAGRRISHGEAFKTELDRYPYNDEADAWIKSNLGFLLPQSHRRKNRFARQNKKPGRG
jgi:hypothetical protein